jgi:hypothetical protein
MRLCVGALGQIVAALAPGGTVLEAIVHSLLPLGELGSLRIAVKVAYLSDMPFRAIV